MIKIRTTNHTPLRLIVAVQVALLVAALGIVTYAYTQHSASAAAVPESCFVMDGVDLGEIDGYNPSSDPLCLPNVTIPETIGGETVTTISSSIFEDDVITSVVFPETITLIESGAFSQPGVALTGLDLVVSGNLQLDNAAFANITGDVNISAAGDIEDYGSIYSSTIGLMTIVAGGEMLGTFSSTASTIDTLRIVSTTDMVLSASYFVGSTINTLELDSGGSLDVESGAFDDISNETISIISTLSTTLNGVLYSSEGTSPGSSITVSTGTALSILSGTFNTMPGLTSVSLSSEAGLVSIEDGSLCYSADLVSLSITAPAGLNVLDGSICQLESLTTLDLPSLGGDVVITGMTDLALTALTIDTTGTVTVQYGGLCNNDLLESLVITGDAGIDINSGGVSYGSDLLESVILNSDATIALGGGTFSGYPALANIEIYGEDINIGPGVFAGAGTGVVTLTLDATNDILFTGGGILSSNPTIEEVTLRAGNDINLGPSNGSIIYDLPELTTLTFEAGNDIILGFQMVSTLPKLTTLTIEPGDDFSANSASFASLTALTHFTLDIPGDITFGDAMFDNLPLVTTYSLTSGGNVGLGNGFSGTANIETFLIDATGSIVINNGALNNGLYRHVAFDAGTTISALYGFSNTGAEDVTITAGGAVDLEGAFRTAPSLTSLAITAGGAVNLDIAFYGTNLQSATITSPSQILDGDSFGLSGASYTAGEWTDLENVRYVAIYATTPNGLVNTAHDDVDVNNDLTEDRIGGFIINPAQITVNYQNESNSAISTPVSYLGRLSNDTYLTNYLVSANPTGDLDAYYRLGETVTFTPPAVASYITPAPRTVTLTSGTNTVNFAYAAPTPPVVVVQPEQPVSNNSQNNATPLRSTGFVATSQPTDESEVVTTTEDVTMIDDTPVTPTYNEEIAQSGIKEESTDSPVMIFVAIGAFILFVIIVSAVVYTKKRRS